jgi:hypothetical protein
MEEVRKFIIGNTYFFLSFYDYALKVPHIYTLVYIGSNLESDYCIEQLSKYYFQDFESYMEVGNGLTVQDFKGNILMFEEDRLHSVYDISGLVERLREIG